MFQALEVLDMLKGFYPLKLSKSGWGAKCFRPMISPFLLAHLPIINDQSLKIVYCNGKQYIEKKNTIFSKSAIRLF